VGIYRSLTDMNVEIGTKTAQLLFWEHINSNFFAVWLIRWWAGWPEEDFVFGLTTFTGRYGQLSWELTKWKVDFTQLYEKAVAATRQP
jgi:hypothetical protein